MDRGEQMDYDPSSTQPAMPIFKVESQNRIPEPSDPSGNNDVWHIEYVTAAGTRSWITVLQRDYTAKHVAERILQQVGEESAVDTLEAR